MRVVNINYVLIMIVVLFLFVVSGKGYLSVRSADKTLRKLDSGMEQVLSQNEKISDIEGYGVIAGKIVQGIGTVGVAVVKIILLIIFLYAMLVFLLATIARAVYKKQGNQILAYRIIMGFVYALLILLAMGLWFILSGGIHMVLLLLTVLLTGIIIVNIRNTYTNRIYMEKANPMVE